MSPKPVRPPKTAKNPADDLHRLLDADQPVAPPRLELRFDAEPPDAKALEQAGVSNKEAAHLAKLLAGRAQEIAERVLSDRAFAQQLTDDLPGALKALDVDQKLTANVKQPDAGLMNRFADINIRVAADATTPFAAQTAAVQLLSATLSAAAGNPTLEAGLRTDPQSQVIAAAAATPPPGYAPGSPALASLVSEVAEALRAAGGGSSTGSIHAPLADLTAIDVHTVRIPTPKGL